MLYQLRSGKCIEISIEYYLSMSDEELQQFDAMDAGIQRNNPFSVSVLRNGESRNIVIDKDVDDDSDPYDDPENSSFVEINYSLSTANIPFGVIDLNKVDEFGGSPATSKTIEIEFPNASVGIKEVFTNLIQSISEEVDVYSDIYNPPDNLKFLHCIYLFPGKK